MSLSQDGILKHILAFLDADLVVIDLDNVDKRLQVGFAEGDRTGLSC